MLRNSERDLENFIASNLTFYEEYASQIEKILVENNHETHFGKGYFRIYIHIKLQDSCGYFSKAYKDLRGLKNRRGNYLSYFDRRYNGYKVYAEAKIAHSHLKFLTETDLNRKISTIDVCDRCRSEIKDFKPLCSRCFHSKLDELTEEKAFKRFRRMENMRYPSSKHKTRSIYIMKVKKSPRYKIGISVNVDSRISSINTSSPFNIEYVFSEKSERARELEGRLHKEYADRRLEGEWFELNEQDVQEIKTFIKTNS